MKKLLYIAALVILASSCDKKPSYESKAIDTDQDSLSYSFGYFSAQQIVKDSILMDTLQMDAYLRGLITAMNEDSTVLSEEVMTAKIQAFVKVIQEQMRNQPEQPQGQQDMKQSQSGGLGEAGEAFLAENKTKEGVIEIENGIQYKIINEGSGASPSLADQITIHYHGTTIDGKVFDSSVERGTPATFPLGGLIPGWQKVLPLMKEGSKWEIFLPYQEAYGERGAGRDIPPYSALIFEIELIKVN